MQKKRLLLIMAVLLTFGWNSYGQGITQGATKEYKVKLTIGEPTGSTYLWAVSPAGGTTTDLSVVSGNTAGIMWDGPVGLYTVAVQVTDGNGCLSETISQEVEILAPGDLVFAAAYPSTITCSDLAGGAEGSVPGHSVSTFNITYAGAANLLSANITIKNPDGKFIGIDGTELANQGAPEVTINNAETDKEIVFSVTDSWENTSGASAEFEIVLVSAQTSDLSTIFADVTSDVTRTVTVSPKPVIEFE